MQPYRLSWSDRFRRLFNRPLSMKYYQHWERQTRKEFYQHQQHAYLIETILNKIANDVALHEFTHQKVWINKEGFKRFKKFGYNDSKLAYLLNERPNDYETATIFWTRIIKKMIKNDICIVIPEYSNGNVCAFHIMEDIIEYTPFWFEYYHCEVRCRVDRCNVLVFENPRTGTMDMLRHLYDLIHKNLERLMEKLGSQQKLIGIIGFPEVIKGEVATKGALQRLKDFFRAVEEYDVGYLQEGETFTQMHQAYNVASSSDIDFLMKQIFNGMGMNENLFTCSYSEQEARAYHQDILKPIVNNILEELDYKLLTEGQRNHGHHFQAYFDFFGLASLNDMANYANVMKYVGVNNSNEVREKMGYEPYDGGDIFETNMNAVRITNSNENTRTVTGHMTSVSMENQNQNDNSRNSTNAQNLEENENQ